MGIFDKMSKKQVDRLMNTLLFLSYFAIFVGALFQLQHYPYGKEILWSGMLISWILSGMEIGRLKRIIKELEARM